MNIRSFKPVFIASALLILASSQSLLAQSNLFGSDTELLSVEMAYPAEATMTSADAIDIQFSVADGYYLYKKKLAYRSSNADVQFGEPTYPESLVIEDEYFGTSHTFRGLTLISVPVSGVTPGEPLQLSVDYQGCADIGVCYPPATHELVVDTSAAVIGSVTKVSGGNSALTATAATATTSSTTAVSEQDRLSRQLGSASLWLNAGTFFVLGLLLAFTPCVLPMIPILSSLIIGQGESITTGKAFRLSLVYVLAMAVTYTIAGVLIGLSGVNLQVFFQNPWILSAFALLFVALAAAMFGMYELQMPAFVQNKLNSVANNQKAGSFGGVATMGFLSALIVGPCVTAPLVGALIYIANTGNALIGGVALFSLSMGMGAPLLLMGASAGKWLPHTGPWMVKIKQLFGFMLLGLAIYMLTRILPTSITAPMFAVLIVLAAVFFGALDSLTSSSTSGQRLTKGISLAAAIYGVALLVGSFTGRVSYLEPLQGFTNTAAVGTTNFQPSKHLEFTRIKTVADLNSMVAQAASENKTVMLDFYADWCVSCKVIEAEVFTDPNVQAQLNNTLTIQADVTANDADDKALMKHLNVFAPPTIIWYSTEGEELVGARLVGDDFDADDFSEHIKNFIRS